MLDDKLLLLLPTMPIHWAVGLEQQAACVQAWQHSVKCVVAQPKESVHVCSNALVLLAQAVLTCSNFIKILYRRTQLSWNQSLVLNNLEQEQCGSR